MSEFKYTAIIVEPRRHKALPLVLQNMLECLSEEWNIVIFHGIRNEEYVHNILLSLSPSRVQMVNLFVDNLDQKTYSALMVNRNSPVYQHIHTAYFLVFQTDSIMFKENAHFLKGYIEQGVDYVGAPWLICQYPPTMERDFIGNGGFSLRKTSTMFQIMETQVWDENGHWQEDLFFTKSYPGLILKKPSYEDAMRFCVDEIFTPVTMACHRVWCHGHFAEIARLYPICQELYDLQAEE
jgi:hypothetical protein